MILLDNGHGKDTPGKRSPVWSDGSQLFEYEFNRDIVKRIAKGLIDLNIQNTILVPELIDISLQERITRANKFNDSILLSIHANAGKGTGWEAYTSPGITKADKLADILYEEANKELTEFKIRWGHEDGDSDKEEKFYILTHTKHPAILSENLFMDTERDCKFIMSEIGRKRIADFHIKAIHSMLNKA